MKNIAQVLNLLLASALVILAIKITLMDTEKSNKVADSGANNETLETIFTRTSIRSYTSQTVEPEKIELLLRAAMAAPTAGNKQPWRFIIITDKDILQSISANLNTMKMAEKAPLAIVVCGDMNSTFPGDGLDYWIEDTSAASENLLLAAHSIGLGAVWCGIYPMPERVSFLQNLLQLPKHIIPLNVIPIGYPAEKTEPKDKWKPENIHNNIW